MPRYPMLLTQMLKFTDTDENCIQVTVSETNKRAGEEDLKNLLTDIKTHLNISMFLVGMEFYSFKLFVAKLAVDIMFMFTKIY